MRSWTPVDQYVYGVSLAVASRYSRYKIRYKIRLKSVTKLKIFFACGGLKRWFFTFRIEMLDCSGARPLSSARDRLGSAFASRDLENTELCLHTTLVTTNIT